MQGTQSVNNIDLNFGRLKPNSVVNYTHTFDAPIKKVTACCNCTRVVYSGNDLSFALTTPVIDSVSKSVYDAARIAEGFEMSRRVDVTLYDGRMFLLTLKFVTYE